MKSQMCVVFPWGTITVLLWNLLLLLCSFVLVCLPVCLVFLFFFPLKELQHFLYRCIILSIKSNDQLGVVSHTCNLSIQKAEMGGFA